MRTVGQILKEAREERYYSLEEVGKATKIRKELLEALENDEFDKLPPVAFIQGFIKNYAQFLGLGSEKLLAIFRRGYESRRQKGEILEAFSNPINDRVKLTPGRVLSLAVILMILSFLTYLWWQYKSLVGVPRLEVLAPKDQQVVENATMVVEGKTDPEAKIYVNNQEIDVAETGQFKEEIKLSEQVNKIKVEATSRFNQKNIIERTVYLKK